MNENNIYTSLDEAREELKKRWNDLELKKAIEDELGEKFIGQYASGMRAVSTRQLMSPDNGCAFFYQRAKYLNAEPLAQEFLGDIFVHFNEEKKGLGRLRVVLEGGSKAIVDVMDLHLNDKKPLGECVLRTGENLADFHHGLFDALGYEIDFFDNTRWYRDFGHASEYYYYMLLHFVAHGVLFETFFDEGGESEENSFTNSVVFPAIKRIREKFGVSPIIIRAYPENQTDEEDFYWWCYPPEVNKKIVEYGRENGLNFKKVEV